MIRYEILILVSLAYCKELTASSILSEHSTCSTPTLKRFSGEVLAFMTPWNSKGYDYALQYASKINYAAPCWYQLSIYTDPGLNMHFAILGEGNSTFINYSKGLFKLVPRIILENTSSKDYELLLESDNNQDMLAEKISTFISSHGLDGAMLELWIQGNALLRNSAQKDDLRALQRRLIQKICRALKSKDQMCMMTIPPIRGTQNTEFSTSEFVNLSKFVDRFALISYDFSQVQPGPNSPEVWIKTSFHQLVEKIDLSDYEDEIAEKMHRNYMKQVMIGVPFYGYEFTPNDGRHEHYKHNIKAITGNDFLQLLEKHKTQIKWEDIYKEHKFTFNSGGKEGVAYYPTKEMIESRVKLAEKLKCGISIWELGQGLEYFFDEL